MKKTLVYGWFGEDNLGDELLLNETLELLSENKDIEAYVMCSNPLRVKKNHCVRVYKSHFIITLGNYKMFISDGQPYNSRWWSNFRLEL